MKSLKITLLVVWILVILAWLGKNYLYNSRLDCTEGRSVEHFSLWQHLTKELVCEVDNRPCSEKGIDSVFCSTVSAAFEAEHIRSRSQIDCMKNCQEDNSYCISRCQLDPGAREALQQYENSKYDENLTNSAWAAARNCNEDAFIHLIGRATAENRGRLWRLMLKCKKRLPWLMRCSREDLGVDSLCWLLKE